MLSIPNLSQTELPKIRIACAYLFSPDQAKNDEFIESLGIEAVRDAFREKAKRFHPDLHGHERNEMVEKRKERFIKIRDSYEILKFYLTEEKPVSSELGAETKPIIAIGGAKGGIGKSIFAVNLAVFLAARGKRTVLVDLDLGGANLHLYLGETRLERSINDFLMGRVPTLEKAMTSTRYGLQFIGGDSSQLGAANIPFTQKLKLLREIKQIEADYIILDLGGDTSYNIIDFFLAANHGLVVTTCDPAAYLEAYNFIKIALYRKLNRIYGAESSLGVEKDHRLQEIIAEATLSTKENRVNSIGQLLEIIREEQPSNLFLINRVLRDFTPSLVINMTEVDPSAMAVVQRIQEVARSMLSITVGYLGTLPYQAQIKESARVLVPAVAKYPKGMLATRIEQIVEKIHN